MVLRIKVGLLAVLLELLYKRNKNKIVISKGQKVDINILKKYDYEFTK